VGAFFYVPIFRLRHVFLHCNWRGFMFLPLYYENGVLFSFLLKVLFLRCIHQVERFRIAQGLALDIVQRIGIYASSENISFPPRLKQGGRKCVRRAERKRRGTGLGRRCAPRPRETSRDLPRLQPRIYLGFTKSCRQFLWLQSRHVVAAGFR